MIDSDKYLEIQSDTIGIYKEKGSKFIAYAFPVHTESDIKARIDEVKKTEPSASHYCYAYILKHDMSLQRTNDDGEPSSSAGKPILGQIISNKITNILIIVVRYFGGIKLGIPGLIRSYKTAAHNSILEGTIITKTIKEYYQLNFKYNSMNNVMRIIKEFNLEIVQTDFQLECKLIFAVLKSKANTIESNFQKNHKIKIKHLKIYNETIRRSL